MLITQKMHVIRFSIMDTDELERIRDNEFYGLDVMDARKVDDGTV